MNLKYADVVLVDEEIIHGALCRNNSNCGCNAKDFRRVSRVSHLSSPTSTT